MEASLVVDLIGNEEFWGTVILATALCTHWNGERYFIGQPNTTEFGVIKTARN